MLPRERPTLLDVTTNIGCSCACSYCAQRLVAQEYAKRSSQLLMTFDIFQRCVERTPTDMTIAFAGLSEPWLNPECTRMVEWAHETGHPVQVFTTLVGMTLDDVERLAAIGSVGVVLHLPSAEGLEHIPVDDSYLSLLDAMLESGMVDHCHCHGAALHHLIETVAGKGLWGPQIRSRRGNVLVEHAPPQTRAGNVQIPGLTPKRKNGRLRCLRGWDHLLLPNGDVLVCSLDYGMRHVLGNLLEQDHDSLFSDEEYMLVLRGLRDRSVDVLCRYCECSSGAGPVARVRDWFVREFRAANTVGDLVAIAPRFVRTGARHLRPDGQRD